MCHVGCERHSEGPTGRKGRKRRKRTKMEDLASPSVMVEEYTIYCLKGKGGGTLL